jgi:hypothetical protein
VIDPKLFGVPYKDGRQFVIQKYPSGFTEVADTIFFKAPKFLGGRVTLIYHESNIPLATEFHNAMIDLYGAEGYKIVKSDTARGTRHIVQLRELSTINVFDFVEKHESYSSLIILEVWFDQYEPEIWINVEVSPVIPQDFGIESIYPNPFNPNCTISYSVQETTPLKLNVFDIVGRLVYQKDLGIKPAGLFNEVLDLSHVSSGTYVVQLQGNNQTHITNITLIK